MASNNYGGLDRDQLVTMLREQDRFVTWASRALLKAAMRAARAVDQLERVTDSAREQAERTRGVIAAIDGGPGPFAGFRDDLIRFAEGLETLAATVADEVDELSRPLAEEPEVGPPPRERRRVPCYDS